MFLLNRMQPLKYANFFRLHTNGLQFLSQFLKNGGIKSIVGWLKIVIPGSGRKINAAILRKDETEFLLLTGHREQTLHLVGCDSQTFNATRPSY